MQVVTERILSLNPRTGRVQKQFLIPTDQEVKDTVHRARCAFPQWKQLCYKERAQYIQRFREIFLSNSDKLVSILAEENGRPAAESYFAEILPNIDLLQYWAKKTEKFLKPEKIFLNPIQFPGKKGYLQFEPLGVIAMIAPWNYPISIPLRQIIPALMAGNIVILKPSEKVPRISSELGRLFEEAKFPEGVFQIVQGNGKVGEALVRAGVQKIFFTGSVATGKKIMAMASETLTPVSLELGGKDPAIVLEDADLERASNGILWGACANAGQSCNSVERVYIDRKIYAPFRELLAQKITQLRWKGEETDVGPLIDSTQWQKVEKQLHEAVETGAKIVGERVPPDQKGYFFPPTLLENVSPSAQVLAEETFGPLLPLIPFDSEEEAIQKANDSRYGLAASVWTRDLEKGERVAKRIEAGHVTINDTTFTPALYQVPWGGIKESGFGKTNSRHALMEMVTPKFILIDKSKAKSEPWWYPYDESAQKLAEGFAHFFRKGSFKERLQGLLQALISFPKRKGLD
ncbi:MAG: aldehyde dehydrogenase family protein [Deltaproteobacteria bacterium]|nr:aldehyde dehydrogenase family protein [Deltaproteobacteria bacterium]